MMDDSEIQERVGSLNFAAAEFCMQKIELDKRLKEIKKEIEEIQNKCPHNETEEDTESGVGGQVNLEVCVFCRKRYVPKNRASE